MHPVLTVTLALCTSIATATVGVDVSDAVSSSTWTCLRSPGGQGAVEFAIARVYQSTGSVDPHGRASIIAAKSAGIAHVDGYMFPAMGTSAAAQVKAAAASVAGSGYGMLWYDIERLNWPANQAANQAFIKELVDTGRALGVSAGIYTNYYNWQEIVGLGWSYPAQQGLQLWYAHYDKNPSFADFQAFGGWSKPAIKQYIGDASSCGVGVDYNWYPAGYGHPAAANNATVPIFSDSEGQLVV